MATFRVELGAHAHDVHSAPGLLAKIGELAHSAGLQAGRAALITDTNVAKIYGATVDTALRAVGFVPTIIEVPAGEASKALATLDRVYDYLTAAELDRSSPIFALGGGVIGDLAGFAAATYLRGLPLVQIPTTLVAQVDSALGGKTAVNHRSAKNLIGAFYQPRLIVADTATLATLPDREFREGLAEVIKYGAIMDAPFLAWLEHEMPAILARDPARLAPLVERSLRHKAFVVANDEHEGGLRKILNFGHTLGHALEASAGYGNYFHGEAVAIGMVAAAHLSGRYAGLSADEVARLQGLIEAAGLPVRMPDGWRSDSFLQALRLDKKRTRDGVEFVLLDRLGHALTRTLSFEEIIIAT
ncbi:MAG TPA: 3-dehydroquinate synthase [Candidatus Binataceae bacterium]|nr:3-dehydroquinate synthase [Candidatus Binataceae bacterium]